MSGFVHKNGRCGGSRGRLRGDKRVISCGGREDLGKWNVFCLLKESWGCKRKYAKRERCALDCLHHRYGSHRG